MSYTVGSGGCFQRWPLMAALKKSVRLPRNPGCLCQLEFGRLNVECLNILKTRLGVDLTFPFVFKESQGESVKNSLLRATLFDISFLMIVHVVQCFGSEVPVFYSV
jgi:hypothetical protein